MGNHRRDLLREVIVGYGPCVPGKKSQLNQREVAKPEIVIDSKHQVAPTQAERNSTMLPLRNFSDLSHY
jgi:hypothetical protein